MAKPTPLTHGESAPSFDFKDADGTELNTAQLAGEWFLVFFYPKDNTPGCTKEACAFRDQTEEYQKAQIRVIGVSCDDEASHAKFRNKYQLPFALASDTDRTIVTAYGVWGEKQFMGKTFDGIHRMSFLVNPEGKIAKVYPKVKPETHPLTILEDAKLLI